LAGKIRFPEIAMVVQETVNRVEYREADRIATVLAIDLAARMLAEAAVEALMLKANHQLNQA
jgi:1-deoxy-D-xylulose-5-phosphate reductoisomerase